MAKQTKAMVRINTRVLPEQDKFIKELAKKMKLGEGEVYRMIIQAFIDKK